MGILNKTQDELHDVYAQGQRKEDAVRHDKEKKDEAINNAAVTQQEHNKVELHQDATTINEQTKDDPEKMGEAFENTFGIPKGN